MQSLVWHSLNVFFQVMETITEVVQQLFDGIPWYHFYKHPQFPVFRITLKWEKTIIHNIDWMFIGLHVSRQSKVDNTFYFCCNIFLEPPIFFTLSKRQRHEGSRDFSMIGAAVLTAAQRGRHGWNFGNTIGVPNVIGEPPLERASKRSWGPPSEEASFGGGLQTTIRASNQGPSCASSSFVDFFLDRLG